jgi:hypothetical protein
MRTSAASRRLQHRVTGAFAIIVFAPDVDWHKHAQTTAIATKPADLALPICDVSGAPLPNEIRRMPCPDISS